MRIISGDCTEPLFTKITKKAKAARDKIIKKYGSSGYINKKVITSIAFIHLEKTILREKLTHKDDIQKALGITE